MKRIIILGLMGVGVVLYSCNGNHKSTDAGESYEGYVSNAVRTPTTMDGQPVIPKQEAPETMSDEASSSESGIDVNAPSDSKGVGPFAAADIKLGKLDAAMAKKGKELFQTYCTACHTDTKQKLIGPGLKGITTIRTPQWILNMIMNPIQMTKEDPVAKALKKELNNVQMTYMGLSKKDARAVLEFLRENDGVN